MSGFALVCLKMSMALTLCYLFYYLVLRRLTFYNWNRWYLLLTSVVSLVLPFLDFGTLITAKVQPAVLSDIPAVTEWTIFFPDKQVADNTSSIDWLKFLILTGAFLFGVRTIMQYLSLIRLSRRAIPFEYKGVVCYGLPDAIAPFSFSNKIFMNPDLHTEAEMEKIISHELVHVRQRHTLDILAAEFICIINWFNPFAWMLRRSIRQNLEFIADEVVLSQGVDSREYQYTLLRVTTAENNTLAMPFNFSSLKKRIMMMNKNKDARAHLVKFIFVLPLILLLLVAFRQGDQVTNADPAPSAVTVIDSTPEPDYKTFLKKNPEVQRLAWNETSIFVHLKNGGYKEYVLANEADQQAFRSKYGVLPNIPPPPKVTFIMKNDKEFNAFRERNPAVRTLGRQLNPALIVVQRTKEPTDKSFDRNNLVTEFYNIEKEEDIQAFEKKYGTIPPYLMKAPMAPPPPPKPAAPPPPPVKKKATKNPKKVERVIDQDNSVSPFKLTAPTWQYNPSKEGEGC